MLSKEKTRRKYSPEFKLSVIMDMRENNLSYNETVRKYELGSVESGGARYMLRRWERVYLEEGEKGFMADRTVRNPKGRPRKESLPTNSKGDDAAEIRRLKARNLYLEAEVEYLKKLSALVQAEEQAKNKKPK